MAGPPSPLPHTLPPQWFDDAAPAVAHACNAAVSMLEAKGLKVVEVQVGSSSRFCVSGGAACGLQCAAVLAAEAAHCSLPHAASDWQTAAAKAAHVRRLCAAAHACRPLQLPELALLRAAHSCTISTEMRNNMCGELRPSWRLCSWLLIAAAAAGQQLANVAWHAAVTRSSSSCHPAHTWPYPSSSSS